jgi:aminoglycoside 6'-N-acetyltransferase I
MALNVRAVLPGDAPAWTAMRERLWPEHDPLDDHAREIAAFFAGETSPTLTAAFVAIADGLPVGIIELAIRPYAEGCADSPVPYVEGWFVESMHRGRGVGRSLMRAGEAWARERGFTELASDAESGNDGSVRAHLSCGFSVTSHTITFRKSLV